MKVAVLMSTYNGEKYIEEQIDSILNQKGNFFIDLWVRDDGSTDSTHEILERYEKAGKLKWYKGRNKGAAGSFMDLVKKCVDYDFYAFADQDDYWSEDKIKSGINKLITFSDVETLYVANAELVDENLKSLGRNVYQKSPKLDFHTLCCSGGLLGCTMIFNNKLARLIQKYPIPEKMIMHDFYLSVLCSAVYGKIIYENEVKIKYRQHGNNVMGVTYGFLPTLKSRWKNITSKLEISIAEQAESLLEIEEISVENKEWLRFVCKYRNSLLNRVRLATTRKTQYTTKNMSFKLRMTILLGNR